MKLGNSFRDNWIRSIPGLFPSAEAGSIEPDMDEAMAEMGFELKSRRIVIIGWHPHSSQDPAWLLDRQWRSREPTMRERKPTTRGSRVETLLL